MRGAAGSDWVVYGDKPGTASRSRTVDMSRITGLTFFYGGNRSLGGIHAHTEAAPFPAPPPGSEPRYKDHVWVHVAVSAADEVTALAVVKQGGDRGVCGLLVRFRDFELLRPLPTLVSFLNP